MTQATKRKRKTAKQRFIDQAVKKAKKAISDYESGKTCSVLSTLTSKELEELLNRIKDSRSAYRTQRLSDKRSK